MHVQVGGATQTTDLLGATNAQRVKRASSVVIPNVKIALLECFVTKMMKLPHRAVHVKLENTWVVAVLSIVWIATRAVLKIEMDQQHVKRVTKDNIKMHLATIPV